MFFLTPHPGGGKVEINIGSPQSKIHSASEGKPGACLEPYLALGALPSHGFPGVQEETNVPMFQKFSFKNWAPVFCFKCQRQLITPGQTK